MRKKKSEAGSQKPEAKGILGKDKQDLQPGEIVDRDGYEAAIHSGSISEIPERNIIFVGKGEPATAYYGTFRVELPDAETQKQGFYHERAREIISQFPRKYKKFIRKG